MMVSPAIVVKGVNKSFGSEKVLSDINIEIDHNKINFIIGRSGGGKTVLLKLLTGLYKPDSGEIWYDSTEINRANRTDLVKLRKRMALLFQDGALFDFLSVGENVAFPLVVHQIASFRRASAEAEVLLSDVGLAGSFKQRVGTLSAGERKRVALARALIMEPEILFFDEPTTGLDPLLSAQVDELIAQVKKRTEATVVVVSHDIAATLTLADKITMLYQSRVIFSGSPGAFRLDPQDEVKRFRLLEVPKGKV